MNKIKIVIWICILYIIQNVFYPIMSLSGITPELLLGFAVSYAAMERNYKKSSYVIIICALLSGTGIGRVFPISVIMTGAAGVCAYMVCDYLRFIPRIIRVQTVASVFVFIMCCCEYFAATKTVTYSFLTDTALWYTVYTTLASYVIYLILKKTMGGPDKKLLITQERD